MNALIRQSIRRWRHWLERKHWQMTWRFRQPPREVAALDPIIANARKSHGASKPIQRRKSEILHQKMREQMQ